LSVNALTADGTKYAQMDATTAHGRDPREVRWPSSSRRCGGTGNARV